MKRLTYTTLLPAFFISSGAQSSPLSTFAENVSAQSETYYHSSDVMEFRSRVGENLLGRDSHSISTVLMYSGERDAVGIFLGDSLKFKSKGDGRPLVITCNSIETDSPLIQKIFTQRINAKKNTSPEATLTAVNIGFSFATAFNAARALCAYYAANPDKKIKEEVDGDIKCPLGELRWKKVSDFSYDQATTSFNPS